MGSHEMQGTCLYTVFFRLLAKYVYRHVIFYPCDPLHCEVHAVILRVKNDPSFETVLKAISGGEKVIEKFCAAFPSLTSGASNSVTQVYNHVTQADVNGRNLGRNVGTPVAVAVCDKDVNKTSVRSQVPSTATSYLTVHKKLDSIKIKVTNATQK